MRRGPISTLGLTESVARKDVPDGGTTETFNGGHTPDDVSVSGVFFLSVDICLQYQEFVTEHMRCMPTHCQV